MKFFFHLTNIFYRLLLNIISFINQRQQNDNHHRPSLPSSPLSSNYHQQQQQQTQSFFTRFIIMTIIIMTIVNNIKLSLADNESQKNLIYNNEFNYKSSIINNKNEQSTTGIKNVESISTNKTLTVNRISFPQNNNNNKRLTKRSSSTMMMIMNHNLHRHHHQHHPHYLNLQQQQQQQNPSQIIRPETSTTMTLMTTTSTTKSSIPTTYHYNNNQRMNHIKPKQQQQQHSNNNNEWHSAIQQTQQQQQQQRPQAIGISSDWIRKRSHQPPLLYNLGLSSSPSSSQSSSSSVFKNSYYRQHYQQQQQQKHQQLQLQHQRLQQQQLQQQQQCPDGPPEQWSQQLDVAGKALLSPIVFYGELISLAEDYGGRIGATFRLLKLIKPDMSKISTINNYPNTNDDLSILIPNPNYETQIKLYFVRNQNESMETPFCAIYMPQIWEKLRTKTRYILFAQQQILSTRGFMLPPISSSSSLSNNDLHKQFNNRLITNDNNHHRIIGHQLISMITYTIPETLSRNTSRLVRKILCRDCAKPARIIHSSRERLDIISKQNITLSCRVDGNPIPWIEWYRNGRRLRTRRRVKINTRRRISQLTIIRASVRRDHGTYECRAMNVVSKEPSVKRFHVNVQWPINHLKHRKTLLGKHNRHPSSSTSSTSFTSSSSSYSSGVRKTKIDNDNTRNNVIIGTNHYNIHQITDNNDNSDDIFNYNHQQQMNNNNNNNDGIGNQNIYSEIPQPCPIASFCLNGGTCSLYKHLGEYVCECADGYKGHRCEYKDLQKYPVKTLVDYDPVVVVRQPAHSYSSKTNDDERADS
uniref:Myb-like protein I n=1 Tax=Dermatophagoides pteronyssinus TaxID=6956 RepID=A0A6P6Y437_DERPT|nr:myb-like protein I [Dermatophagoides pteronyssinus]